MEKTTRSLEDKLEKYEEDNQKLNALFEIEDNTYLETEKFKVFCKNLERKNELRKEIMAKKDKVFRLKKELDNKKKTLEVFFKKKSIKYVNI